MSKNPIFFLPFFSSLLLSALSQQNEFIYNGFNGPNNITLDGVAAIQDNGIVRLTNDTRRLIGRAFYPFPLHFKNSTDGSAFSFSSSFAFAIVPEYPKLGGHGFAFTVAPAKAFAGAQPSQYLGILNASDMGNSSDHLFAVEFDTVQDFEFGDINDNHIGIDINSMVSNASVAADLNLKSGDKIQAWVDYDGVGRVINVSISPFSSKPRTPILSFPIDLSPVLQKDGMHVGFSASTGLLASSHYLFAWSFKINGGAAQSFDLSSLPSLPKPKKKNTTFIVAAAFSAFLLLTLLISAAAYLYYKIKNADVIEPWELSLGPHRFSYDELKRATKGFRDREVLGVGGFGKVYKGTLPGSKKTQVAVKRISNESRQGIREFVAEIATIGRLRHRHLVQLQGWCRRRADLLLVYDYMPNGSLDQVLFSDGETGGPKRPTLSWDQRFKILKGVAFALLYLHEEWEHVVIHRDVKASNVLLDGELNGRLGDFGLAKLHEHGANPSTTRVVGTLGYLAPELTRSGKATTGSDVFAFGALALEVVCGRRPIEPKAAPEELVLVDWVWEKWRSGKWSEVVDVRLEGGYDAREAEVAVRLGLMCSHPASVARPRMREVVGVLEGGDVMEVGDVRSPFDGFDGKGRVGFDDFVNSYPSSYFDKVSWASTAESSRRGGHDGPFISSPLSVLSHGRT